VTLSSMPGSVLLVGGTSHTGERVARRLRRMGVAVRVLTRNPDSPVAQALLADGCEVAEGDTLRRWRLWEAAEGVDMIVSCAHIKHAEAVVQACHRVGRERLVLTSSARRYSRVKSETVGKVLAGEAAVTDSDLEWTILRPTMIFGGSRDRNMTRLVEWVGRHSWVPVIGNGRTLIQPVFVEDLVTAIVECMRRPHTARRDYNLAGPEPIAVRDAIQEIASQLNKRVTTLAVPAAVAKLGVAMLAPWAASRGITPEVIGRQLEDKTADILPARQDLAFAPRPFRDAIMLKLSGGAEVDALYHSGSGVHQMIRDT